MGTCLPHPTMHHHRYQSGGISPNSAASPSQFFPVAFSTGNFIHFSSVFNRIRSSMFHSHCSFHPFPSNPRAWSGRCHASSPGPPPPPKLEPPSGENRPSGALSKFSQVKDTIRIFFAVLFWMSLFFWSCVWDGTNNGRSKKGPPFR